MQNCKFEMQSILRYVHTLYILHCKIVHERYNKFKWNRCELDMPINGGSFEIRLQSI